MQLVFPSSRWKLIASSIALFAAIPLLVILSTLFVPEQEIWSHLLEYTLPELLLNTVYLLVGVGGGVLVLGVFLAWVVAVYDFPGRRFFSWALMLPLAMPAYVMAFAQLGLLDFSGPLQTLLRGRFGSSSWVPDIRSTAGVIIVMTLAFYPYVYLLARNAFSTMGRRALEVGQSLGMSHFKGFFHVVIPMSRPWIVGGMTLALMETLADFGTVSIFNFDTFTTAIYKAWFSFFSLNAAQQLASILIFIVFVLVWLEQRQRGRRAYTEAGKSTPLPRLSLSSHKRWLISGLCSVVFLIAFILPFSQVLAWAWQHRDQIDQGFGELILNSLLLSIIAALLVLLVALMLSYAKRRDTGSWVAQAVQLSTLGYAVPGTVLAVGVFVPVAWLDNMIFALWGDALPEGTTSIVKGTLVVLLLAYCIRFLAVGYAAVNAAMQRITRSQEEAARNMGYVGWRLWHKLHIPLLKGGVLTAVLMVFVDVMKEMPITLMTRPYGWDTLAVKIFNLTTEGEWEQAALPSVAIVLAGLIPVILLSKK